MPQELNTPETLDVLFDAPLRLCQVSAECTEHVSSPFHPRLEELAISDVEAPKNLELLTKPPPSTARTLFTPSWVRAHKNIKTTWLKIFIEVESAHAYKNIAKTLKTQPSHAIFFMSKPKMSRYEYFIMFADESGTVKRSGEPGS